VEVWSRSRDSFPSSHRPPVNRFRASGEYATFYAEALRHQAHRMMTLHKTSEIDSFDEKILQSLRLDARKTSVELADVVGLSPSSCQRRQRDLEQRGIIRGYRADIDP